MTKPIEPLYYPHYLKLDQLLDCQNLKSVEHGKPAHDELLFITVHQVYELWFKQILHEVGSVIEIFTKHLADTDMGTALARLNRVSEIQRILIDQIRVMETMTALDFLDFRDYLTPASGFQSVQFRTIEAKLGLRTPDRTSFSQDAHRKRLEPDDRARVDATEGEPSLFDVVAEWLERTPFLDFAGFSFWDEYRAAVDAMLSRDRETIRDNPVLSDSEKQDQMAQLTSTEASFDAVLDRAAHDELVASGTRRLSYKATQAALFIELYRDYPVLQAPHHLLSLLADIDEQFTTWRHRHALMAHRMIGRKIGSGGSAGHKYLKAAAEKHKVFGDLFDLSTYLLPRSALPKLPSNIAGKLSFSYQENS